MKQDNMLAMILAGGRGTRLHDLTKKVAKPAVSYGGKYRIIDYTPISELPKVKHPVPLLSLDKTKQIQDLMYTEELPMRSPRISTLSILILRSIS